MTYLVKHQEGLQKYLKDPRIPISNILAEHVAKSIAIARKNFIFCDTPSGAEASGKIFSMIETAKANGHHPWKYLLVLLTELPNARCTADVDGLLPWNLSSDQVDTLFSLYRTPYTVDANPESQSSGHRNLCWLHRSRYKDYECMNGKIVDRNIPCPGLANPWCSTNWVA